MTTPQTTLEDDLAADRQVAEELQDRLRREEQTAAALRAYLISKRDEPS
ncbi:MAG: hypothetical protein QOE05_2231 [Actinomycetota bacterium]|jgi:hypothetical protein|nr:hypothetical protein [Actinomycetota bacterium]